MATGDTIKGSIQVVLEDRQGNQNVVFGSVPQAQVDYTNEDPNPDEKTYINTRRSSKIAAPAGAKTRSAPNAVFEAGEKILIQHKASASVTGDIDHDADAFLLEGVTVDLNRNNSFVDPKTVADQRLEADVTESTDGYVTFYEAKVDDRERFLLAGEFEAVAIET